VSVTLVDDYRGESLYAFPPVEVTAKKDGYFSRSEKYEEGGGARRISPAPFPHETTLRIVDAAKYVHKTLGLRHYSQVDLIVRPDGIYFIEANSLPGLTPTSLLPMSLETVGESLQGFLGHVVECARVS